VSKHPNIPESAWNHLLTLAQHPRVDALLLFGSRAFGDHGERSDVDIAVIGAALSREDWALIKDRANLAQSLFWINLVHFDRNPERLRQRILTTGFKIHEKKTL
jgi:predicted nucleotidyltransferase